MRGKNSKYRDANSELWGKIQNIGMQTQNYEGEKNKNIGMQTQNYGGKLRISGCKLRIMGENSEYRDANSELWGKNKNIGMPTQNYEEKWQNCEK